MVKVDVTKYRKHQHLSERARLEMTRARDSKLDSLHFYTEITALCSISTYFYMEIAALCSISLHFYTEIAALCSISTYFYMEIAALCLSTVNMHNFCSTRGHPKKAN